MIAHRIAEGKIGNGRRNQATLVKIGFIADHTGFHFEVSDCTCVQIPKLNPLGYRGIEGCHQIFCLLDGSDIRGQVNVAAVPNKKLIAPQGSSEQCEETSHTED